MYVPCILQTTFLQCTAGDPHRTVAEQQACDAMMECQTTLQCLEAGYETAVEDFPDPATAMQHLLWCIFMILLVSACSMFGSSCQPVKPLSWNLLACHDCAAAIAAQYLINNTSSPQYCN